MPWFWFINAWPNKQLLNYSILEQWKDIIPAMAASALMAGAVWAVGQYGAFGWLWLGIQIIFGIAVYVLASWLLKLEPFCFLLALVRDRIRREGVE